jgi:hypothetical protein
MNQCEDLMHCVCVAVSMHSSTLHLLVRRSKQASVLCCFSSASRCCCLLYVHILQLVDELKSKTLKVCVLYCAKSIFHSVQTCSAAHCTPLKVMRIKQSRHFCNSKHNFITGRTRGLHSSVSYSADLHRATASCHASCCTKAWPCNQRAGACCNTLTANERALARAESSLQNRWCC